MSNPLETLDAIRWAFNGALFAPGLVFFFDPHMERQMNLEILNTIAALCLAMPTEPVWTVSVNNNIRRTACVPTAIKCFEKSRIAEEKKLKKLGHVSWVWPTDGSPAYIQGSEDDGDILARCFK